MVALQIDPTINLMYSTHSLGWQHFPYSMAKNISYPPLIQHLPYLNQFYSIFQEQSNLFDNYIYICHEEIKEYSYHKLSKRTIILLRPKRRQYNFNNPYHKMTSWRTGKRNAKIYNVMLKHAIKLSSVYKETLNHFLLYLRTRNKKIWVSKMKY